MKINVVTIKEHHSADISVGDSITIINEGIKEGEEKVPIKIVYIKEDEITIFVNPRKFLH